MIRLGYVSFNIHSYSSISIKSWAFIDTVRTKVTNENKQKTISLLLEEIGK